MAKVNLNNAEARFAVIETQMEQNVKDHETIIKRIDHNCLEAQTRFDKIENMLQEALDDKASKWVEWFAKSVIVAVGGAVIAFILFMIEGQIIFK